MKVPIQFDVRAAKCRCALAASLVVLAPATVQAAVTISTGATKNMTCVSGVCSPNHKTAVLNITDLQNLLATSNVTVTTGSGSLASQTLDIIVNGPVTWADGSTLTLEAYRSITINKSIAVTGTGGVALVTNDGGTGGMLSFGAKGNINFANLTSSLTINGAAYTLVGDIISLAVDITDNPGGNFALASDYDAQADGTYSFSPVQEELAGVFEGLGNTIRNLTVVAANGHYTASLFDGIAASGEVRDFGLVNAYIRGRRGATGALVTYNAGVLSADYTSGRIVGANSPAGGLVGINAGTVTLSYSKAVVRCTIGCVAGGLVGQNYNADNTGSISNCYATGLVAGPTNEVSTLGGLVGGNLLDLSTSYSTGGVTGEAGSLGGLVGGDSLNASLTLTGTRRRAESQTRVRALALRATILALPA